MKLSQLAQGRDNNFNLIRILAALAVLATHSFTLATGRPETEPLRGRLGLTIGSIAVDIFFITSGFLVTASLLNRRSIIDFYIYAFPVQQTVAALIPEISISALLAISTFITLLLAALSWHLLEHRALGLKTRYIDFTRKILARNHLAKGVAT